MNKRIEKITVFSLVTILLTSFATAMLISPVFASQTTKIYVTPPSIIDQTWTPPKTFKINVTISVTNLYGFQYRLSWDNTLLDCVERVVSAPTEWGKKWSRQADDILHDTPSAGYDTHVLVVLALSPAPAFTGNWTFCEYTFQVKSIGSTSLDLYNTKISDPDSNPIIHIVEDGYFSNAPPAKLSIKPLHHIATNLGQIFTVNITVSDVNELYGYEFKLYYNTSLLTALDVELPSDHFLKPVDPFKISITYNQITDNFNATHGEVWFGVTLSAPEASKNGSGTLVKVRFNTTAFGGPSPLKLLYPSYFYPVKLFDPKGSPMPCTAQDGSVTVIQPPPAKLYVDPPQIVNPSLTPCNNFTVSINILNATEIYSWEFKLFYKNTILNATHVAEGPFLNNSGPTSFQIIELNNNYNDTHGVVWLNCSLLTPPPVYGQGTLATITFHVEAIGETTLNLTDTILKNPTNKTLSHYAVDGYFDNVLRAHLFVDPPSIVDPTIQPPAYFNISIKVANVTNLYGYEFKLGYNTTMLNCLGAIIMPHNDETNFLMELDIDDATGLIWVNVTYYPPAEPFNTTEPVTLAIIFFQVTDSWESILDLHDTRLADYSNTDIPHRVSDGYIKIFLHDVAIIDVVASTNATYVGRLVYINVTAENQGDIAESFNVSAYYDAQLIGTTVATGLMPGANVTLSFVWDTSGVAPCHWYNITGKASIVPYEVDTADNVLIGGSVKIKMLGDFNGDGIIDIFDLVTVGLAFDSKPGDPNWNEDADIIKDDVIDIFDLAYIGMHFEEIC